MLLELPDRNKLLVQEQAYQLFQNAPGSAVTQIIVAALFYILFNNSLNQSLLVVWCGVLFFLAISRLAVVWFYNQKEPIDVKYWLNLFTFMTLLMGVTWACFSLFYLTIDDVGLKYIFFVVICALVTAAVPILAAWTPAYYANTLPQLISLPIILIYSSSTVNTFLAASFVVYCSMLLKLQRNANDNIRMAIELRHQNDALVLELGAEIEQREQLIELRTQELNRSLDEKTAIVNNKLVGIAILHNRRVEWANSAFEKMLGYGEGEMTGCLTREFYVNEEDYQAIGLSYSTLADGVIKDELEFKCKNGKHIWINMMGSVLHEKNGQSLWVFVDISERKKATERLRLSSRIFSSTHEGIMVTDAKQNIVDVNSAFCKITGYSREEVIDQRPQILSSDRQSSQFYADMWQEVDEQGHWQGEIWNRKKNGEVYAELLTISELKDSDGIITNFVGIFSDITGSKQQQEELKLLAHYDVLTKLPNRILFTDRFHRAVAHSKRSKTLLALCFLDLDDFKPINDNYGHGIGDQLLIEVSSRITACIREVDTVARLGGDEFAILLGDTLSYDQCLQTMDRIHHSLAKPYLIEGTTHQITASSGITLYPLDDGDVDTLLRHADQAMYLAKQAGRNCYQLFNVEEEKKTTNRNIRLTEIEHALKNKEFCLYYQPKVNMVSGEVFGVEALIRWNHPEKGLIPPLEFLPIIDGTNLEINIGEWVTNEALEQLDFWQQQGIRLEVSINISSRHLLSDTFALQLAKALAKYPSIKNESLQLEILESSVLSDIQAMTHVIESCQNTLGVSFALDDFGTGYSSLTHLRNLPADTVKIDQTFIRDMLDDPNDYTIIDGVIGLAESFNRNVIAEGVETTTHGLMLLLMGCELAQGYGISKPMPADKLVNWLLHYTPNQEWLHSGNKLRTRKERERKLFKLTTEQWKNKFVGSILSGPEVSDNWPVMDVTQCPCCSWFKRAERTQLCDKESLQQLKQSHDSVHNVANEILNKYKQGSLDKEPNGLKEFYVAFDEMKAIIKLCK